MIELDNTEWALVEISSTRLGVRVRRRAIRDARSSMRSCSWPGPAASGAICRRARAWLEVAAVAYLFARLRVEPA